MSFTHYGQWIGVRENLNRKLRKPSIFPWRSWGLNQYFFPLNQFVDMEVAVETSITTLPFFRSRCWIDVPSWCVVSQAQTPQVDFRTWGQGGRLSGYMIYGDLPSGYDSHNYGKSPCLRTVNHLFLWAIYTTGSVWKRRRNSHGFS